MIFRFWFLFLILIFESAHSATFNHSGFQITVEPIVGYELTQVSQPIVHTRGMLLYGGRVTAGHRLVSGEGEFTLGTVNETFPTQDQNLKTEKQNARLGVRSVLGISSVLDLILRLGGQATRLKVDTTTLSTATTLTNQGKWDIRPYAGTGLQLSLLKAFSLAFEASYVFRSLEDWSQNDLQTTASVKFHLPSK